MDNLDSMFNSIFLIDMILRFFVDYYDIIKEKTILTQPKLALNYLRGDFLYDFVATVPFRRILASTISSSEPIHSKMNLLYLIKIIRISKL